MARRSKKGSLLASLISLPTDNASAEAEAAMEYAENEAITATKASCRTSGSVTNEAPENREHSRWSWTCKKQCRRICRDIFWRNSGQRSISSRRPKKSTLVPKNWRTGCGVIRLKVFERFSPISKLLVPLRKTNWKPSVYLQKPLVYVHSPLGWTRNLQSHNCQIHRRAEEANFQIDIARKAA